MGGLESKRARRIPRAIHRPIIAIIDHLPFGAEELLHRYNGLLGWIGGPYRADTHSGARIDCDPRDLIESYILHFGVWEPGVTSVIKRMLRPGDVFVDVGANIGYDSLLAASLVGEHGRVLAFEASPTTFDLLLRNLALNPYTNVVARQLAVSDRRQQMPLYFGPTDNRGKATTIAARGFSQECLVQAHPLTELFSEEERSRIRLIKIDIEGGEVPVINDFLANLDRYPDATSLIVEVNPSTEWQTAFGALTDAGFRAFAIPNRYDSGWYIKYRNTPNRPRPVDALDDTQMDVFFTRDGQWLTHPNSPWT